MFVNVFFFKKEGDFNLELLSTHTIISMIKKYCKENKISLSAFARKCNVSKSWLSKIMNKDNRCMSLSITRKILDAMGYDIVLKKHEKSAVIYKKTRLKKLGERYEIRRY